jgi:uncharacterized protein (DUF2267 family)
MRKPPKDKSADTSLFSAVRQVLETEGAKTGLNELSNVLVETFMERQSQSQKSESKEEALARAEAEKIAKIAKLVREEFEAQGLTAEQAWEFFMGEMKFNYEKKLKVLK